MALAGPSGSGKTFTALTLAAALGNAVAVIDTERGSASKYADLFEFDVMELDAPYHPDRYIEAINEASKAGYDVLVIDSLSHAWNGQGGLLEIVEQIGKRSKGGNSFAAWADATPIQNRLINAILNANLHLIVTMRSKQDHVQERDEKTGRTVVRKIGMAPVQRDGMEYEFDVACDLDTDNTLIVTKSRCPALSGAVISKPGKAVAETLQSWLAGAPAPATPAPATPHSETPPLPPLPSWDAMQVRALKVRVTPTSMDWENLLTQVVGHTETRRMTDDHKRAVIAEIQARLAAANPVPDSLASLPAAQNGVRP